MSSKKENVLKKADIIVISIVILIAVVCYFCFSYSVFGEQAEGVEIFVNGNEYATYSFSEISEKKIVEIKTASGYNVLEISGNNVRMLEASCADKVDVQAGNISKPGQMLICAPNKVSVRIIGKSKSNIDKVTY